MQLQKALSAILASYLGQKFCHRALEMQIYKYTTAVAALHNREDQNTLTCFAFNAKREQKALILYSQCTGSFNFRVSVAIHST